MNKISIGTIAYWFCATHKKPMNKLAGRGGGGGGGGDFLKHQQHLPQKTFLTCFSVWLFPVHVLHFVVLAFERD